MSRCEKDVGQPDRAITPENALLVDASLAPYQPPSLEVLGTLAELTRGSNTQAKTDATFPGSMFA